LHHITLARTQPASLNTLIDLGFSFASPAPTERTKSLRAVIINFQEHFSLFASASVYIYECAQGLKREEMLRPPPPAASRALVQNRREEKKYTPNTERASQVLGCFFSAMKSALKHVACNYVLFTCV